MVECVGGREGGLSWTARNRERGREKERRPHGQRGRRTEAEEATGDDGMAADTHSLKSRKERERLRQKEVTRRRCSSDAGCSQHQHVLQLVTAILPISQRREEEEVTLDQE